MRALLPATMLGAVLLPAAWAQAQVTYTAPDDDLGVVGSTNQKAAEVYYLEFVFERPRWITAKDRGGVEKRYFYMPYKVVNYGKDNVPFSPDFVLLTGTAREYRSQTFTPVLEEIRKTLRRPWLVSQSDLKQTGIPGGEGNAKFSAAIFEEFDPKADEFAVFVGALTNTQPQRFNNPLFKKDQPADGQQQPQYFYQNRVFKVSFKYPGFEGGRGKAHASVDTMEWVWR